MAMVLLQPDLGTSLTYVPILLCGLFLGGLRIKQAAILLLAFSLLGGIAWKSGKLLKPYQKARLTAFMDPDNDPKGSGYQIRQSLIAVGSGGIWGKGTNKGTQTQGDFLPIPYTDFIFAAFSGGARLCRRGRRAGALLPHPHAPHPRTPRPPPTLPGAFIIMGIVAVIVFQSCRQHRHGRRPNAGHRHPAASDELRWIIDFVHLPGPRNCDEHSHPAVRKLRISAKAALLLRHLRLAGFYPQKL